MKSEIEQPELNFSKNYLVCITPIVKDLERDCAIHTISIYQKKKVTGISNFVIAKNMDEFEICYMGNWNKYFSNLKEGIEKRTNRNNIINLKNG